jgi:hypothetical protein
MSIHVQTGNMLDLVVEGKSLGLRQRDSDHRKYETIWLPDPQAFVGVLQREINRLNPTPSPSAAATQVAREIAEALERCEVPHHIDEAAEFITRILTRAVEEEKRSE